MAYFKYSDNLVQNLDPAFDSDLPPGSSAPYHGIYKCISCGDEVAMPVGHTLPPQNHRQHQPLFGQIAWRLVVASVQRS